MEPRAQSIRRVLLVIIGAAVVLALGIAFGASAVATADVRWTSGWFLGFAMAIAAVVWLTGIPSADWGAAFGFVAGLGLLAIGHAHLYIVSSAAPEGGGFFSHLAAYAEAGVEYTRRLRWGQLIDVSKGPNQIWFGWMLQAVFAPLSGAVGGLLGAGYVSEERAISSRMRPFKPIDTAAISSVVLESPSSWLAAGAICLAASLSGSLPLFLLASLAAPYLYSVTAAKELKAPSSSFSLRGFLVFLLVAILFSFIVALPSILLFGLSASVARMAGLPAAAIGAGIASLIFVPLFHRLWLAVPLAILRGGRGGRSIAEDVQSSFASAWHLQRAPGSFVTMTIPALVALFPQRTAFIAGLGPEWYSIPLAVLGAFYVAPLGFVIMMERGLRALEMAEAPLPRVG